MIKKLLAGFMLGIIATLPRSAHAFNPVRQVQISTNTLSQQSGAFNVQSGSMTVLNVTNTFKATGTVTLGGGGSSVTISSNAIIGSTTFYQAGPALTNAAGYIIGSMVGFSSGCVTTSSATIVNGWVASNIKTSAYAPKAATDLIKVRATGGVTANSAAGNDCYFSFVTTAFPSADVTATVKGIGYNGGSGTPTTPQLEWWTSPGSVAAVTYYLGIRSTAGNTCTWNAQLSTTCIWLEDFAQ